MEYRIIFDCADNAKMINRLLDAASGAGAGRFGNHTRCAIITKGYGTWKSERGSHPNIGKVGKISKVRSAKIDLSCDAKCLGAVCSAIRKAHPYEEPNIYVVKVEKYA